MTLKEQLVRDMQDAMRSGDELRKDTIRMARAAIQSAETERRTQLFGKGVAVEEIAAQSVLDDEGVQGVLAKSIKQRREAAEEYARLGRQSLADKELAEIGILEGYLPRQMSDEQVEAEVAAVIAELGVSGSSALRQVMPAAMSRLKGKAEGRAVNRAVTKLLAQGDAQ